MKHQAYYNRALTSRDPRYARIFEKLGYSTANLVAEGGTTDIQALRDLYEQALGKKPFNGWDAATLNAKIAEKRAEG